MVGPVNRRPFALDAALLLVPPLVLVATHVLAPPAVQRAFALDHGRVRAYTLFTAAYVHASNGHLLSNLAGYALTAPYAYALCLHVDERRWFRRTLPAHLTVLPILVNLTSYAIFATQYPATSPTSRGFSGVVAGLGGFLLVALHVFVEERHDGALASAVGVTVLLLLMQLVDLRYAGGLRVSVTGFVVLGSGAVFVQYARRGVAVPEGTDRRDAAVSAGTVGLVGVVLAVLMLALFPETDALVEGGTFTNVFAHGAGFVWGAAMAAISRAVTRRPTR